MESEANANNWHVLTEKEAQSLLLSATDYMYEPDRKIGDKERADILAEAALRKGHADLSETIAAIHSSVVEFHKGNYKALQHLLEEPVLSETLSHESKGTGFETAVERQFKPLQFIAKVQENLDGESVDWEKSAKVLLKVKAEKFPRDLSMVEKLTVAKYAATPREK